MVYTDEMLARFHAPSFVGEFDAPNATGTDGNPTCGDVVRIQLLIEGHTISGARFKALGCAITIAASDAVCEMITNSTLTAAEMLDPERLARLLGPIPEERRGCVAAALNALQDALFQVRNNLNQ